MLSGDTVMLGVGLPDGGTCEIAGELSEPALVAAAPSRLRMHL